MFPPEVFLFHFAANREDEQPGRPVQGPAVFSGKEIIHLMFNKMSFFTR